MACQTTGIQQLLSAERRAAEKVTEARKRKAIRLKQAKDEAVEEIEKYRAQREAALKEYEEKFLSKTEGWELKIEADTKLKIEALTERVAQQKENIINDILELVYDIKPEVHRNFDKK